jgi:hypothetical protein
MNMPRYRIKAGKHHGPDTKDGERVVHLAGEVISLPTGEAAKFANKFELVADANFEGGAVEAPVAAAATVAGSPAAVAAAAAASSAAAAAPAATAAAVAAAKK